LKIFDVKAFRWKFLACGKTANCCIQITYAKKGGEGKGRGNEPPFISQQQSPLLWV
jgi:hypothetical protein